MIKIKLDIMKAPLSPPLTMASLENLSVKLTVTVGDGTSQKLWNLRPSDVMSEKLECLCFFKPLIVRTGYQIESGWYDMEAHCAAPVLY